MALQGRRENVAFFCLILPHSNVWFVKVYPRETPEAFLDSHVSAFAFLGGVPRSILYDNTTSAAARTMRDLNPIERLLSEIKRRTDVVGIFPNEDTITGLVGAVLLELNDEWAVSSRNVTLASIAPVSDNLTVKLSWWQLESPAPPAGYRLGREALTHGPRHDPTQRGGDKCPISTPEDAITSTRTQTQNRSTTTLVTAPSASELPVSRRPT